MRTRSLAARDHEVARLLSQSDRSQETADAYGILRDLVATDPRFAVLREFEVERLDRVALEYADDAEDLREQMLDTLNI